MRFSLFISFFLSLNALAKCPPKGSFECVKVTKMFGKVARGNLNVCTGDIEVLSLETANGMQIVKQVFFVPCPSFPVFGSVHYFSPDKDKTCQYKFEPSVECKMKFTK